MTKTGDGKWNPESCEGDKSLNGIVEGTSGDDTIDLSYTGDPDGDKIDNLDAIQPGVNPNSDIVDAGAGDDTVHAGAADDTVYGGSGSDLVYGEAGNDVLYGDSNAPTTSRESFEWDKAPDPNGFGSIDRGDNLAGGFSQDTGSVVVDFSVLPNSDGSTTYTGNWQATEDIETGEEAVDNTSGMRSHLDCPGDCSSYELEFSESVENVSFRINDIDRDSVINIQAFDADGNPIEVNLTGGSDVTMSDTDSVAGDDTADSNGGSASYDDLDHSVLVDIAGPVASIVITHTQDGSDVSAIGVTDIYFDTTDVVETGVPGDDTLIGGEGDDILYGEGGNDVLVGGAGADELYGGDGADVLGITIGDTVVQGGEGGEGGEGGSADFDTLIAQGLATIEWDGGDPSSESGTVTFYDSDLNPIGTVDYSEIERGLVLDVSGNTSLDASGTTAGVVDGTDNDDVIDVNYTDDPEGDMIDHNDALPPLQGNEDIVLAGAGDDVVMGGLASDVIFGESGNDTLFGEEGGDALGGGDGDDFLSGGEGSDIVAGGAGDDTISGDATVAGDSGDLLFGNEGDDSFVSIGQGDYIDGGEDADGQDVDVLDLSGAAEAANPGGTLSVDYDPANGENGTVTFYDADGNITGTAAFENIESVVCFTLGTLIATPKGERKIEDLKIGDRVITRDNGIQTIRWMGRKTLTGAHVKAARHLRPVLIQQGALGNGLPERDMMVSPNHRVLIANDKTALYFEEREVLVAAKHLTGLDGVDVVDVSNVTYIHFMFDQHEVVLSDGAWTESFQPGDHSLAGIGNAQRNEMFELFPELESTEGLQAYHSARRSLKKHEAQLLSL